MRNIFFPHYLSGEPLFALKAFNDAKKIKNTNAVTTLFFILLRFFMQKYLRKYKKPNLFVVNSCR